ncbi:MAG TPA: hypothetical protein VMD02_00225 [Candidatus Omnitrophota bacterium]|nr:hypothetical protein [Candidatus Omnitrophota bacterium]
MDKFAANYTAVAGRVLNFNALFRGEIGNLYVQGKQFGITVINPRSFSAVNDSYSHHVGDIVRDRGVDIMLAFYQSKGVKARVFELQGINRVVLVEGIDAATAEKYATELRGILESTRFEFSISPNEIEDPAARERFRNFIAKREGIPATKVDNKKKYSAYFLAGDKGSAPMAKKDGTVVPSVRYNMGVIAFNPNDPASKQYSAGDIEKATIAVTNRLNQENPTEISRATLDVILKNVPRVDFAVGSLSSEAVTALKFFAMNEGLQRLVLEDPIKLQQYLIESYRNMVPSAKDNIDHVEIARPSGAKTPHIATVEGKAVLVVPLLDATGNAVAEVRMYGKDTGSFASYSGKLGDIFTLTTRTIGGVAYKWSSDIYRDPKSSILNRDAYYKELARMHSTKTRYVLVRGDLNSYSSWNCFNEGYSTLGTDLGDKIFEDFSRRATEYFRKRGVEVKIARLGGDEVGIIVTGENATKGNVGEMIRDFGVEMKGASLKTTVRLEDVPKQYREYVKKTGTSTDGGKTYEVDLYKLPRFAAKYNKTVVGFGVSWGVHNSVNPATDIIDPLTVDKETDGISNRAKNGTSKGQFKISLDRRGDVGKGVRDVFGEDDAMPDVKNVTIKARIGDRAGIRDALTAVDIDEKVTFVSNETVKISAGTKLARAWVASEDVIFEKFKEAGLYDANGSFKDNATAVDIIDVYRQLPEKMDAIKKSPLTIDLLDGRKATVTYENNAVTITVDAEAGKQNGAKITLNVSQYKALVEGKAAYNKIVETAIKQNPGVDPGVVRERVVTAYDRIKAGLSKAGANVTVEIPLFELTGTRTEVENALLRRSLTIDLGGGKSEKVMVDSDSLDLMLNQSTNSAMYKSAREAVRKSLIASGMDPAKAEDITTKIERQVRLAQISTESKAYFEIVAETEALRTLDAELAKIEANSGKMSPGQIKKAQEAAYEAAGKRYALISARAYEMIMDRAKTLDLAKLPEAEVRKIYEQVATEVKVGSDAVPAEKLDAEIKATTERINLDPKGKGVSAYLDYYELNAPGAGVGGKMAAVGVGAGRAALMGFVVEFPFALYKTGLSAETFKSMVKSGLSWGKFEAISRLAQISTGLSAGKASAVAIGLTTLWDISAARPEDRGMVMVNGAVGLGGFMALSKIAGVGLKFVPGPKWLKEGLAAGAGILGSTLASWGLGKAIENNETIKAIAASPELNFVANGLSLIDPGVTALFAMRVGTNLFTRIGWGGGISILRYAGPIGAGLGVFFWGYGDNAEKIATHHFYRDQASNKSADLYTFATDGKYYFSHHADMIPSQISTITPNLYISRSDPVFFEMAVMLRKQGYLPDNPELAELLSALDGVDLSKTDAESQKKAGEAFAKYNKLLKDEKTYKTYVRVLFEARRDFIAAARASGYDLLDSQLPPAVRAGLGDEFVKFVVAGAMAHRAELEKSAKDVAAKYYKSVAGAVDERALMASAMKGFRADQIAGIKSAFSVTDTKSAGEIYDIAMDEKKDPSTAADEISAKLGGSVPKQTIEAYVAKMRLQKSILTRQVKLQRSVAAKQVWSDLGKMGYLQFLRDQKIPEKDIWKYMVGDKFPEMFARFLVEKKWRDEQSASIVAVIKGDPSVKMDDAAKKSIKASYDAYMKQNPAGTPINFAEQYLKKNWDCDRATVEADARAMLPKDKLTLLSMPAEVRKPFIEYLKKQHPEIVGYAAPRNNMLYYSKDSGPTLDPLTDFTPEMAMLLISGRLSKK